MAAQNLNPIDYAQQRRRDRDREEYRQERLQQAQGLDPLSQNDPSSLSSFYSSPLGMPNQFGLNIRPLTYAEHLQLEQAINIVSAAQQNGAHVDPNLVAQARTIITADANRGDPLAIQSLPLIDGQLGGTLNKLLSLAQPVTQFLQSRGGAQQKAIQDFLNNFRRDTKNATDPATAAANALTNLQDENEQQLLATAVNDLRIHPEHAANNPDKTSLLNIVRTVDAAVAKNTQTTQQTAGQTSQANTAGTGTATTQQAAGQKSQANAPDTASE